MPRTPDEQKVKSLRSWHGFKDSYCPAVNELESCIKAWVTEKHRHEWPEDDWITLDNFKIGLWIENEICRATVFVKGNYLCGIGLFFGPVANWSRICEFCGQEMSEADTCTANEVTGFDDGNHLPSVPFDAVAFYKGIAPEGEDLTQHRCGDCGVKHGGHHHPGCDTENCPRCGGRIISCECGATSFGKESEEW